MALQFPSLSILFPFFLFLFILLKLTGILKNKNTTSKQPPGPRKLPLIGNLHQLAGSLPHHALRDLAKKYGPLMHVQLGQVSTVVISSPEIAKQVMKTHDVIFATRPQMLVSKIMSYDSTDIVFAPYGEYWRQIRKICIMELLSPKQVQALKHIREDEISNLIKLLASKEGTTMNLTEEIYSMTYSGTSRAAFGKKSKDQEEYISVMTEVMKLSSGFYIADLYPSVGFLHSISGITKKFMNMHQQADRILEDIVNQHKIERNSTGKGKGEDQSDEYLVDVLLKLQEDEKQEFRLTTRNIKAVLQDIFTAGSDASATTIEWAISEMLKNPSILRKAQDEVRQVFDGKGYVDDSELHQLKYMKLVIKETLRLHPPLPLLLPRESQDKCEINGYQIPAKTKVLINAWAIGRDSNFWDDGECFKPERFLDSTIEFKGTNNFEYIPFGGGRRVCPGMTFGLATVELSVAKLLYHFDWKLPNEMKPTELSMEETFGATVARKDHLHLIPIVRRPF
uniref:Cytochrome P450 n=1 Tax=Nothapodytes nimmoniana TaxID=159386 RepID=A0A7L7RB50_NOTNI|nr:cytochrome P450 [Nothapodytes nimmoniana]